MAWTAMAMKRWRLRKNGEDHPILTPRHGKVNLQQEEKQKQMQGRGRSTGRASQLMHISAGLAAPSRPPYPPQSSSSPSAYPSPSPDPPPSPFLPGKPAAVSAALAPHLSLLWRSPLLLLLGRLGWATWVRRAGSYQRRRGRCV